MSGAFLNTANLRFVDLSGANLRRAFLTGACLRDAQLNGAQLQGVDLSGADLTGVGLDGVTNIEGADFTGVRGLIEAVRAMLFHRILAELDSGNYYTRTTTCESLNCDSV